MKTRSYVASANGVQIWNCAVNPNALIGQSPRPAGIPAVAGLNAWVDIYDEGNGKRRFEAAANRPSLEAAGDLRMLLDIVLADLLIGAL
jgi:hypothetical protein